MDDTKKMLRAIMNGQSAMKQELLDRIKQLSDNFNDFKLETSENFKKLTNRLDMIGRQVANVDDDAPNGEEFDKLVERVNDIEKKLQAVI